MPELVHASFRVHPRSVFLANGTALIARTIPELATSWAGREVIWMFAGRFSFNYNELDPEIWYGHSLGLTKKL